MKMLRSHKFMIISNFHKTSKVQQLYKVSMKDKTITHLADSSNDGFGHSMRRRSGEEELKYCE